MPVGSRYATATAEPPIILDIMKLRHAADQQGRTVAVRSKTTGGGCGAAEIG
jgi:hypothetical protein